MAGKTLRRLVEERRDDVERVARAHGAERIRRVGSVARGDEDESSDAAFLVRFPAGRSLFDQVGPTTSRSCLGWRST
jgi:predicted nucleotidyltransferase